ncbi:MAG: hypothetical protein RIS36_289 [Pseudomonadota bacterium]|jgi:site-specific recombinase XerD
MTDSPQPTNTNLLQALSPTLAAVAAIPEEEIWLAKQKSLRTRRAYRQDVLHFMQTVGARSREELSTIDHKAVIAWERYMREVEGVQASTIR